MAVKVQARCDAIDAVSVRDRDACRQLLQRHFLGVDPDGFRLDWQAKTHVIRWSAGQELVGFSTLAIDHPMIDGRTVTRLYSGDTVMDPTAWSEAALAPAWFAATWQLVADRGRPAWWLLLCSGVRTYRLLTAFWKRYVPHHAGDDPALLAVRDRWAQDRFGARYRDGVVRLERPQRLVGDLAVVPTHYRQQPATRLFLQANPGHGQGDELVCCCPFALDNLSRTGRRVAETAGIDCRRDPTRPTDAIGAGG